MSNQEQPTSSPQTLASQLGGLFQLETTADGATIVLSPEQFKQLQTCMLSSGGQNEGSQQYGNASAFGEAEEYKDLEEEGLFAGHQEDPQQGTTQQLHFWAEGDMGSATADQGRGDVDLVTFHSMDAQENTLHDLEGTASVEGVEMSKQSQTEAKQSNAEFITEEVIESINTGEGEEESFLAADNSRTIKFEEEANPGLQSAAFPPVTWNFPALENAYTTASTSASTAVAIGEATKQRIVEQQQLVSTNYAFQPTGDDLGQGQTLMMDRNQLEALIRGSSITLGADGKRVVLAPSAPTPGTSRQSSPFSMTSKSQAEMATPDQLQSVGGAPTLRTKRGNNLTAVYQPGEKYIAVSTGNGNQVRYLRVVRVNKKNLPKVPAIKAAIEPNYTDVVPNIRFGQTMGSPADTIKTNVGAAGPGNVLKKPNYVVKSKPVFRRILPSRQTSNPTLFLASDNELNSIAPFIRPSENVSRKACKCGKSKCVQLYCECFKNGQFCHPDRCKCSNCHNNIEHEEYRKMKIGMMLERTPGAFQRKISKSSHKGDVHASSRTHTSGCRCRRSGCLKNYCECFEAKVMCSEICKCLGCKNCIGRGESKFSIPVGEQRSVEAGTSQRQTLKDLAKVAEFRTQQQIQVEKKLKVQMDEVSAPNNLGIMVPPVVFRDPRRAIPYKVVTATTELLLAKAESCEKQRMSEEDIERQILEEFGDCLTSMIEFGSTKPTD